ncbi:MAG: tRNA guanosine(34) transglycosylase Tgt [Chloroflexi bacterium]|nr:tRNA guanosine(34) transglycosylase Tgt [Chloroflexota bacterium]
MEQPFSFTLEAADGGARAGRIQTGHGEIATPAFMPVGTQATVKTLSPRDLHELGAQIILGNTYHLYLRPGDGLIAEMGGLHKFMSWNGPILTDSGGYQVFSLSERRQLSDGGVIFKSHIDGSQHLFTPDKVVAIQENLGSDIMMPLDHCAPYPSDHGYNVQALERTHRWAVASKLAQSRADQALFGIVQGGTFADLRRESALFLRELDLAGYSIGGLSVGEPKEVMHSMLEECTPLLPEDRPRYLMGVGSPEDLFECVERGIDMFDCVLPTRIARNGAAFVSSGRLNLRNSAMARDERPIQEGCACYTCRNFSRSYLRHLFKAEEILGLHLATIHNVHFLLQLMRDMRSAIIDGTFATFKRSFIDGFRPVDYEVRMRNREARAASLRATK